MKAVINFFLSLKTVFWSFLIFIAIMFLGSMILPDNLAFFSGIDDTPLFKWLADAANLKLTWWIYALILMLAFLAVSTLFCTAEAFLKRPSRRQFIAKLSPQIMHIGVLFIMLGHLLTASAGVKMDMVIKKGEKKTVTGKTDLYLEGVKVLKDQNGYGADWEARLLWSENNGTAQEKIVRPVHPQYIGQFGLYIKSVATEPETSALIRVCRDPGAAWALLGGVLLSIGGLGFVYAKSVT